jgi:fermentation-respiration switch protein FrsA (DUF1100 family)
VERAWAAGCYDGLLGFSQGAALGGLLGHMQHNGSLAFTFDFCILVSGFVPDRLRERFDCAPEGGLRVASLHVVGEKDALVPPAGCLELAGRFRAPSVLRHPGGHFLPHTGDSGRGLLAFLQARGEALDPASAVIEYA